MGDTIEDLIQSLTALWYTWIENDKIARDTTKGYEERKTAAQYCETLVNQKYRLMRAIDEYFEAKFERT